MYGFLQINNCILTDKDFHNEYKKFYCSQCYALHKIFGYKSRFLVSYDATFLNLLVSSQQQEIIKEKKAWCAIFPKKISVLDPQDISLTFSACISIVIFYMKLSDSLHEKKTYKKNILNFYQPQFKKAKTILKSLNFPIELLNDTLKFQENVELIEKQYIEKYAEPSAKFFAEIFSFTSKIINNKNNVSTLHTIGYHIGKIIYLIDSFVDIVEDIEKKQFNALLKAYQNNNGEIDEKSNNEVINIILNSLNAIRLLTKDLILINHEDIVKNFLIYGFPKIIQNKINKSIKKIKNNSVISLKYLPHTALASVLFSLTTKNAEAIEFVSGKIDKSGTLAYGMKNPAAETAGYLKPTAIAIVYLQVYIPVL